MLRPDHPAGRPTIVATLLLLGVTATAAPASRPASSGSQPASQPAAPRHTLRQLVAMARSTYPGVEAARQAIAVMERDVFRARWAWVPSANVQGLLAPAPDVTCYRTDYTQIDPKTGKPGLEVQDSHDCTHTNTVSVNSFDIKGVLARIDLQLGMPLFTFGKISSAKRAAGAGVDLRQAQLRSAEDKLEVDVTKAYWGLKLAREILFTVREGRGYIVDAEKNIEKDLDEDLGEYTMTDLLRIRTSRAEVDVRVPEAEKLEQLTLAALKILTGQQGKPFDVDTQLLEVIGGAPMPAQAYVQIGATMRPDLKLLEAAVRARQAAVDLERARFFPDFLLVAMLGYGRTTSIPRPDNAFYSNPFNYESAGFGLAMSWRIEPVLQYGSYRKAQAEALETRARQAEAALGVELDITRAQADLVEARKRLEATRSGEKTAKKWLVATSQNLAAGLAETRDLTDALVGFFQLRLRYLQAIYDVNVGWSELARAVGAYPQRR